MPPPFDNFRRFCIQLLLYYCCNGRAPTICRPPPLTNCWCPMKIATALMWLKHSGAFYDVRNFLVGLTSAGHEALLITSGDELPPEFQLPGVPFEFCPLDTRSPGRLWANGKRLAQILEDHEVDVLNTIGVYPGLSGYWATRRLLKKGKRIPNVVTIHNLEKLKRWYYLLGSWMLNRVADHVIVVSECEKRRLQDSGTKRPVTTLYSGLPTEMCSQVTQTREEIRREMGWPEDTIVFLMAARMSVEKRHDRLMHALTRPELKGLPFLCYLAGHGPLLEKTKQLASELGVSERVTFGGLRRDMPRLYKAADALLLCSQYESLPLTIREAMLFGLPVISTNVGGVAEAIEDGRSGLLVPPDDPAAFAGAMARLAVDAPLRQTMGRRGYEICRQKFDVANWVSETVRVMSAVRDGFQT
jgi:glycosyltransferase involved in cell wall biosynthesis